MPGPVSDSYDPEWSTSSNRQDIVDALDQVYESISTILGNKPPKYILDIVHNEELGPDIKATLCEKTWRILRFACERAKESL